MITEDKITEIFCLADDFCKFFLLNSKNIKSAMANFIAISPVGFQMQRS